MLTGNVGALSGSQTAGKQPALSAGTEPAASESTASSGSSADANFQQALSSALQARMPPVQQIGNLPSRLPIQSATDIAQIPVNEHQLPATANRLIPLVLAPLTDTEGRNGTKQRVSTRLISSKEETPPKEKTAIQSEPPPLQISQALWVAIPVGPELPIPVQPATASAASGSSNPISTQPSNLGRDLPGVPATPQSKQPPTAPLAPKTPAAAAPDSLSFALLLHPKLARTSTDSSDFTPRINETSNSQGGPPAKTATNSDHVPETEGDSKIPAAPSPDSLPQRDASAQNGSNQPALLRMHGTVQPDVPVRAQQSSGASIIDLQEHGTQDSPSFDSVRHGRSGAPSGSDLPGMAGSGDMAKLVPLPPNPIPNTVSVHNKTPESVAGTPLPSPALNTLNPMPSGVAKEVVVRLQGQAGESISLRVVDQGGQVQVAVRSSDPATANQLRQDLSTLTTNLDRVGWKSEVLSAPMSLSSMPETRMPETRMPETSHGSARDGQNSQSQGQGTTDWNQQDSSRRKSTIADLWDEILIRQAT